MGSIINVGVKKNRAKKINKKVRHILKKSCKMKSDETTISGGQNMPYINFTEKLFGLQDLIITNIKESDRT
ncbi:MAG: hypothetical protein UHY68_07615, partial [Acutalibacteraceae bacterium]|nr:hypothetical protein [Acutalibacteraceae bacterium]